MYLIAVFTTLLIQNFLESGKKKLARINNFILLNKPLELILSEFELFDLKNLAGSNEEILITFILELT